MIQTFRLSLSGAGFGSLARSCIAPGLVAACLGLSCGGARAAECSDFHAEARRVQPTDSFYEGVNQQFGRACIMQDFDRRSATDMDMDYYTRSKSRCEGTPGFLRWVKDGGSGYNLCIFNPPEQGSAPRGGAPSAPPAATGPNSCRYANDGACDEPDLCAPGTDTNDCRSQPRTPPRQPSRPETTRSTTTRLTVCNKSGGKVYVAYSAPIDGLWRRKGWRTIAAGECDVIGTFPKNSIYLYAENDGRKTKWAGDLQMCVMHPGPFDVVAGTTCAETELYFKVESSADSHTVNLN